MTTFYAQPYDVSATGFYFDNHDDYLAKASTAQGRDSLEREDSTPHSPNDADSKEHPFQHGTEKS